MLLSKIASNSIHLVLTDPPYFLDGLDNEWKKGQNGTTRETGVVGKLPVGMKFDKRQGIALQEFMTPICQELHRVLVPGGFFVCFSQPRLYHRLAVTAEDSGFEIRDLLAWHFTKKAQFKAFSLNHFVEKMDLSEKQKKSLKKDMEGRKTPQLRPQFEAMMLAQKSKAGTFLENWRKYRVGLMDARRSLNGGSPTTVMTVEKPLRTANDDHLTMKPVPLLKHIIELFTSAEQVVLDPFLGSGSTCIAAFQACRASIGIEINPEYVKMAFHRLKEAGFHGS